MPLYYFSTVLEDQHNDRDDPIELPDDRAAWGQAAAAFGDMLKEVDVGLKPNTEWRLDVRNEEHALLFSLKLIPESYL